MSVSSQHFKYSRCPDCNAPYNNFSRATHGDGDSFVLNEHVHGGIWETITFPCGRQDAYLPNFMSIKTERVCTKTPEAKLKRTNRAITVTAMKKTLSQHPSSDATFHERITRELNHLETYA
jgi:hypothetical protein